MKFKRICLNCYKSVHNRMNIRKSMIKKDNFIILYKLMMNDHIKKNIPIYCYFYYYYKFFAMIPYYLK